MSVGINSYLWNYFNKTETEKKVQCKLCQKLLSAERKFNLQQHLIIVHKITDHPAVQRKRKNNITQKDNSHFYLSNVGSTVGEEILYDQKIVKSDYEITEEVPTEVTTINEAAFDYGDDIQHDNSTNVSTRNSTERQVITTIIPDITELSPNFKKNVPLREQPARTKSVVAQPQIRKNTSPPVIDPLEDSGPSTKDDNFDQWVHKKEKLMHLEYLEMRNYKFKLELWEKEQQLRLVSSKYTRDLRNNP